MSFGGAVLNPGKQANAMGAVGDYASLAAQLNSVLTTLAVLKEREATHAYSEIYAGTATYALNPDGTPGPEDPTPVPAHPMVGQFVSANDVDGFAGYIVNDLFDFLTGVEGPTIADRRPALFGMLP